MLKSSRLPAFLFFISLLAAGACDAEVPPAAAEAAPKAAASSSGSGSDRPHEASPSAKELRAAVTRDQAACRAMSQTGVVRWGSGEPLRPRDMLSAEGWLELEAGARLMVKHTETAREWTLEGPALAAFCPRGREEVVLGRGKLRTELGAGVRPGAEVTVGTAFGRLSYGDARLELAVSEQELRVSALSGEAWLTPAGEKPEPALRIAAGGKARRARALKAADAVSLCAGAARNAAELAARVTAPSGSGPGLGQRAAEHVRARQAARSACANAAAAVIGELRGRAREERLSELSQHESVWQRVPGAAPAGL